MYLSSLAVVQIFLLSLVESRLNIMSVSVYACFNPVCDSLSFMDLWFVSSINFGKFLNSPVLPTFLLSCSLLLFELQLHTG